MVRFVVLERTKLDLHIRLRMSSIEITKETYLQWYESMLLMRKFEEKAGQLYGQQKIRGFCHLSIVQEAVMAGAMSV